MNIEKQIENWLLEGIINQEQSEKMLLDVSQKSKEEKSNKFIIAVSTIGSILLGMGAIIFVASNWVFIPNFLKIIILMISTLGTYYLGYLFKYDKQNLPKVGASLFFLSTLLFGASIFLVVQMYNINANAHFLLIIWLIGILPLAYVFNSESITTLSGILFYVWIGLFIFRDGDYDWDIFYFFPIIYLFSGTLLYSIGGLHKFSISFKKIGRILGILGIFVVMFSLFLLTFETFSTSPDISMYRMSSIGSMVAQIKAGIILFAILSIIGLVINLFLNPSQSKTNLFENGTALGLIFFTLLYLFFPSEVPVYTVIYNLMFAAITIILIYVGYQKSDMQIVNAGIFWISIFLLARYFDFFWNLMPRSLFFIVGGLILVLGGIALEKKRKQIKDSFNTNNIINV